MRSHNLVVYNSTAFELLEVGVSPYPKLEGLLEGFLTLPWVERPASSWRPRRQIVQNDLWRHVGNLTLYRERGGLECNCNGYSIARNTQAANLSMFSSTPECWCHRGEADLWKTFDRRAFKLVKSKSSALGLQAVRTDGASCPCIGISAGLAWERKGRFFLHSSVVVPVILLIRHECGGIQ